MAILSIIILTSLFTTAISSKIAQSKSRHDHEQTIVLKHETDDRNFRRSDRILAVTADTQLSVDIANLMDAHLVNSIRNYDDYIRTRDNYQSIVNNQRNIINEISKSMPVVKDKLSKDEAELLSVDYNLDSLKNQSNILVEQLDSLKRLREFEKQDFQEKLKDSRALIIGIERTQESVQDQAVGDKDLNQVAVHHIMSLMKNTMESLETTMKHDIKTERQADKNFKDFIQKSKILLASDKGKIESLSSRKKVLEPEIIELKNKVRADAFKKSQAEVVLAQAITDLDDLNRRFNPNRI